MLDLIWVNRKPGSAHHHGLLLAQGRILSCALGRAGPTVFKREGDGASPAYCAMRPQAVWFRPDRVIRPRSFLPVTEIGRDDGWCDAPDHPAYNNYVRLPFAANHERMQRADNLYDLCVVLDYNRAPNGRKRFGGSAIFMHCAKQGFQPTQGCIALEKADLIWLLQRIDAKTRIIVAR